MTSDTSIGKDSEDSLTYFNDGGGGGVRMNLWV